MESKAAQSSMPSSASNRPDKVNRKPLITVTNLTKHFPITRGIIRQKEIGSVQAVDGVSFEIYPGETLSVVGESGCGKSTLGRLILGLLHPSDGEIVFETRKIHRLEEGELRRLRGEMQIIFQDPYGCLNPRLTVGRLLREPLDLHASDSRIDKIKRIKQLLNLVGLSAYHANRYPHEFSGGQRQRIGVARALASNPRLVVCDEPVSALDVSIQAQVLNLLNDLQRRFHLSYLFISHDLAVVKHISDRVAVMYLGKLVEVAPKQTLYARPAHPYTQALLSAIPIPDPTVKRKRILLQGDVPSPINPPNGCHFHTRCFHAQPICEIEEPAMREVSERHRVACHHFEKIDTTDAFVETERQPNQRFERLIKAFYDGDFDTLSPPG